MLDELLHFILKQRLLVILGSVALLVVGIFAWKTLPIDAFPDVTNQQVMILTKTPGLSPAEVERLVTFPIEFEMAGLPDVKQVRSLSKTALSQVIIIFEDDVDTYFARQVVFERLSQVKDELPKGVEPELGPVSTGLGEIYQYVLEAGYYCPTHKQVWSHTEGKCPECDNVLAKSQYSLMDLRTIQNWVISPQLRRLFGVTEINSFGGFVKQYHVIPDPDLLIKYSISLDEIMAALQANNANTGGSYIERDWEQINVVSKGLAQGIPDIETIVLKAEGGTPVYLKDIAQVEIGHQTRFGIVTKDGKGEAVIGMVIMLKDSNSKLVVDRVLAEIPKIQKSLPAGVRISPFYDRTGLIQACVGTVSTALGQGIILIVLVLFLFLWDIRAAFAVAISLPMTAATAFLLMGWQGVTGNLMSLGGLVIAIGMIVDGSIVVIENIARHMRQKGDSEAARIPIAFEALREVAKPVIFSILIIMIVFIPLFTLESMEGKMFKPLALTICFALIGSLLATLTIVPVVGSILVKRTGKEGGENILVRMIQRLYLPVLTAAVRGRWITISIAAAVMVASFSVVPKLGTEFLPALNEGAIAINIVRLPTASIKGSALQATEIEKRLLAKFPEIETIVTKTGRAEIAEDPMGPEQNDLFVMLKPNYESKYGRSSEELVQEINSELAAFPGIKPAFSQPIALRVNELISGIKSDVAVKIFGNDMEVLRVAAEKISPILSKIEGASDLKIEQISGFSEIQIHMNREELARHKVNIEDINLLVRTAVGGGVATTIFEGQKRFDVQVRFPLENRRDIGVIEQMLVPTPAGYNVPLGELVTIEEVEVPAQISREDSTRRLIVECNVRGRDMGSFVTEAQRKLTSIENQLPDGYWLDWGGQFENQQRAMHRLKMVVPASVLLIFLMLFSSLNSLKSAILILVNLPFALVGGILAIYFLNIHLSVAASIGFIALLGVAVENGLVLVTFFDQLRAGGRKVHDAVVEACRLRVRPLLMTTLTTLMGLLPMLYATGAGSEIQKPLVAVIFGGLISSLCLTLIILPVLYMIFNRDETVLEY
ncbi:MAG: CusA/CzcA family heavy metal efflux RND transporter [Sedimentisphaerales bacterium]|nr:CusA/CzcA family heavy metal efflux RND transporter [Sedimentisphaerales bacterium]